MQFFKNNQLVIIAEGKICPSSIASYLSGRGLNIEVCKPKFHQRLDFNVATPILYPPDKGCTTEEMLEWLGAYSLDIKR